MRWRFADFENKRIPFMQSLSDDIDSLGLKLFRNRRVVEQYTKEKWSEIRKKIAGCTFDGAETSEKKEIHAFLKKQVYNDRSDIRKLLELLSIVNEFMLHDAETERLYSFLCNLIKQNKCTPLQLASTSSIRFYPTHETLPHPYFEQLKQRATTLGIVLGDYAKQPIYLIRMMGVIIGFVFTKYDGVEKVIISDFDKETIREVFQTRYPRIQS
jgi:hypothetical protein